MRTARIIALGLALSPLADAQQRPSAMMNPDDSIAIDNRVYYYFVSGLYFEGEQRPREAIRAYRQAWQLAPYSYEIGMAYARSLLAGNQTQAAIDVLTRVEPNEVGYYLLQARALGKLGDTRSAITSLKLATELDSTESRPYELLSSYYRRNRQLDSLAWAYENIVRIIPINFRLLSELGSMQAQLGRMDDAEESFIRSLTLAPNAINLSTYRLYGQLLVETGRVDSGLAVLEAGAAIEPRDSQINRTLLEIYSDQDTALPGIAVARRILDLEPQNRGVAQRLGIFLTEADSLEAADSVFTALYDSGDLNPLSLYYLGRIKLIQSEYDAALPVLEQLTRVAGEEPQGWLDLGYALRQLGNLEQEIETYLRGLPKMRTEPDGIRLSYALGAVYERTGRYDEAQEVFEQILEHDPDNAQALNYLGYMLADQNLHLSYAEELIARALEIEPENAAFLDSYGWVWYRLGDFKKAIKYLEKAASQQDDPVIFDHLGDAYHARGKAKEARQAWERALELQPENDTIRDKLDRL